MVTERPPLPTPRGPLSDALIVALSGPPGSLPRAQVTGDPCADDDFQLALHIAYELHYRSFAGVDDTWEWDPALMQYVGALERAFEAALREKTSVERHDDVATALDMIVTDQTGPSLSSYLLHEGTRQQVCEFLVHRSGYQLKEADPHTWVIPRLTGPPKANLVAIQADEYGAGDPDAMHCSLFAATMRAFDLDATYGAYLDVLPGATLATGNLITMFGLHRRLRGALVGHFAAFEMTSVVPMSRYTRLMRRLGVPKTARRFFDVHIEADTVHGRLAQHRVAGALARMEPPLRTDILFGAGALMDVERRFTTTLLDAWHAGRSSLFASPAISTRPRHRAAG